MQSNVNKLSQRGENLDVLQNKTDNLKDHADGFRRGANRVRKDMRWKNIKMWMWIIAGIAALILVIVLACKFHMGRPAKNTYANSVSAVLSKK